ncbi:GNAT family N-acetyltransferase [Streptomyces anulatus]|uniref:GNAT family N-acetyltransferase n=1 Tax=Streptomyces anulatus TaxID=1892 RepID=UPI0033FED884
MRWPSRSGARRRPDAVPVRTASARRSGGPSSRQCGRLLLRHAEETLLARYATVRLETFPDNARAKSFYEACGWVLAERLEGEGPAELVYTRSGTGD